MKDYLLLTSISYITSNGKWKNHKMIINNNAMVSGKWFGKVTFTVHVVE